MLLGPDYLVENLAVNLIVGAFPLWRITEVVPQAEAQRGTWLTTHVASSCETSSDLSCRPSHRSMIQEVQWGESGRVGCACQILTAGTAYPTLSYSAPNSLTKAAFDGA